MTLILPAQVEHRLIMQWTYVQIAKTRIYLASLKSCSYTAVYQMKLLIFILFLATSYRP